jgi:hypothetical protein
MSLIVAFVALLVLSYHDAQMSYSVEAPIFSRIGYILLSAISVLILLMLLQGYLAEWRRVKRSGAIRLPLKVAAAPALSAFIFFPNELFVRAMAGWPILASVALYLIAGADLDGSIARFAERIVRKREEGGQVSIFPRYPPQTSSDLYRFDLLIVFVLGAMLLRKLA